MSEHNRHRRLLYWLVGILFLLAAAIFFVKLRYFDFSLDNRAGFFYRADASVSFDPEPARRSGSPSRCRTAGPPATASIRSPAAKNNSGLNCRTGCVAPCSNCRPAPAARPFHTGSG